MPMFVILTLASRWSVIDASISSALRDQFNVQCVTNACLMNDFCAKDETVCIGRNLPSINENGKLFIRALRSRASLD